MKKTRLLSIAAISLMISLVGCNWQIPENVAVKTNAEYEFSAGSFNKSLDEYLDIKKMLGNNQGLKDKGIEIYDYFPGKANPNLQQYLMKVPLADIPIDLDSFMAKIDLTNGLKAMEFNKEIKIPKINIPDINNPITFSESPIPPGVTLTTGLNPDPVTIELPIKNVIPANIGLVNCKIKDGNIGIEVTGLNEDATYEVTLKSEGGLGLSEKSTDNNTRSISLVDGQLQSGPSNITLTIKLQNVKSLNNPQVYLKPTINSLKEVTVNLGKDMITSFTKSVDLPKEVTSVISKIVLEPSGFEIKYTNQLPKGNNITIEAKSDFIGIPSGTNVDLIANTTNGDTNLLSTPTTEGITISETSKVDFTVNVKLPGATNESPTNVTINDIQFDKAYKIGLKLTPKLDWKSVTLNPTGLNSIAGDKGLSNTVDLQVNLHKMLTDLGNNFGNPNLFTRLQIKELPIYLFCTKPTTVEGTTDPLENLQFSGTGKLMVGTTPVGYILGDGKIEGQLSPVAKLPDLKIENGIVTRDFKNIPDNEVSLKPKGLAESIKTIIGNDGNLSLDYNLKIEGTDGEITLEKASLQGKSNISLVAYIDLGFALGVDNDIDISLASLMKLDPNKDILDGNLKMMKDKGIDKYLEAIDEVAVNYNLNAIPYHPDENTKDIGIYVKIAGLDQMDFGLHGGKIAITKKQVLDLLNAKDPALKMEGMGVVIPKGSFSIPRNKNVSASLGVNISTDGTVTLIENGQPAFGGTK